MGDQITLGAHIAAAAAGAGEGWLGAAVQAIATIAAARATLTSDDVWTELGRRKVPPSGDARAMGAAFRMAAGKGWVVRERGTYAPSTRKSRHQGPVAVWRSLLWTEPSE